MAARARRGRVAGHGRDGGRRGRRCAGAASRRGRDRGRGGGRRVGGGGGAARLGACRGTGGAAAPRRRTVSASFARREPSSAPVRGSPQRLQRRESSDSGVRATCSTVNGPPGCPPWDVDAAAVRELAGRLGSATPPSEAAVTVDAGGVRVREGRAGYEVDSSALRTRLESLPSRVRAPTIRVVPEVTTAEARATAQRVERLTGLRRTILSARSRPCSSRGR